MCNLCGRLKMQISHRERLESQKMRYPPSSVIYFSSHEANTPLSRNFSGSVPASPSTVFVGKEEIKRGNKNNDDKKIRQRASRWYCKKVTRGIPAGLRMRAKAEK